MSDLTLEWTWLIKVTLLLAAVWLVWFAARKSNPRWQVWPLRVGLLGVVLLSLVSFAPPLFEWPVNVVTTSPKPVDRVDARQPLVTPTQIRSERSVVAKNDNVSGFKTKPADLTLVEDHDSWQAAMPQQVAALTVAGWNWPALALKFWGFIVTIGLLRIAAGMWRLRQLVARSAEPSDAVSSVAATLASALHVAVPAVRVTDEISSPSVVGLLRPVVLLPPSIAESNNPQTLASALSHELAHIAGNDLRWDAALRTFHLLAWPHPLVWGMHRTHRTACEHVSDLVAADLIDDRTAYADCLASIALKLQRSGSNYGLAMARQADVVTRLKTLASGLQAKTLGRRGKVASLATVLIALAIGTTTVVPIQQSEAEEPAATSDSRTFVLTVLSEEDDKPLVDAEVKFTYRDKERVKETVLTDQSGIAKFTFPNGVKNGSLKVFSRHPGYAPHYTSFERQPIELLPNSKTIRMKLGEVVGGIIVDAKGGPVGNAKIGVIVPSDPPNVSYFYGLPTTGPDGRWSFDAAPRPVSQLLLRVRHDQLKNEDFNVRSGLDQEYALESGWIIAGTVRSADQTPVANAKVVSGARRDSSYSPKATTDMNGAFQLVGLGAESTWLTVTADGHSPAMKKVEPQNGKLAKVDWVLQPGRTIRFQFEDPSGTPIEGASISADIWRGYRSLKWRSKANADGFVEWTGAPEDTVIYDSGRKGFRSKRYMELLPREKPHTIVLELEPESEYTVTGNVTDAETGKPVTELAAEFGFSRKSRKDGSIRWRYRDKIRGRNGEFSLAYDKPYSSSESKLFVRVTADGYQPWVSKELDLSQPAPAFSIELEPGSGPSAVVLTPTGKPAQNAVIALGLGRVSLQFGPSYQLRSPPQKAKTDADGRFQLQVVEAGKDGVVAVVHDAGYAEASLADVQAGKPIQLQAWAKLEIRVVEGGQPVAGRKVAFYPEEVFPQSVGGVVYSIEAETDASGVVLFDRVVPRDGFVTMVLPQEFLFSTSNYSNGGFKLDLKPGQSESIQFGGGGRSVSGRIKLPDNPSLKHSWRYNRAGTVITAGKEQLDSGRRWRFLVADDGTFRVPELPLGKYELSVSLTEEPSESHSWRERPIGSVAKRPFEINDESPANVDLGVLKGEWRKAKGGGNRP